MLELRPLTEDDVEAHNAGEDDQIVHWLSGCPSTEGSTRRHFATLADNARGGVGKRGFGVWLDDRLAGYVDDLGDALRGHRGFLSPILSGAGVKTKVLDAMSVGLPVVATRLGVEGIPVTSGRDALVSDTTEGFVEHVRALQERPTLADDVGRAGHELLSTVLSADRIRRAWHEAVEIAMDRGAGPARA